MKVRYRYPDEAHEFCTRQVVQNLVGRVPDQMASEFGEAKRKRVKVLSWHGMSVEEADYAAMKIRANMSHPDPRRNVEVEV